MKTTSKTTTSQTRESNQDVRVPGGSDLGMSIDLFSSSLPEVEEKKQVVEFDWSKTRRQPVTEDVTYLVPAGMNYSKSGGAGRAHSFAFATRTGQEVVEKVEDDLKIKAEYNGAHGSAGGYLDRAIAAASSGKTDAWFMLVDCLANLYTLENLSGKTSPALLNAIKNLPTSVSAESLNKYMSFFDAWGGFYLDKLVMGGRYFYLAAVESAHVKTMEALEADGGFEFAFTFHNANFDREYKKDKTYEAYQQSREHEIEAVGGNPADTIQTVDVGYVADSPMLKLWLESLWVEGRGSTGPGIVKPGIKPVWSLWNGGDGRREALEKAFFPYMQTRAKEACVKLSGRDRIDLRGSYDLIDHKTSFTVECWFKCESAPAPGARPAPIACQYADGRGVDKDEIFFVGIDTDANRKSRIVSYMGTGEGRDAEIVVSLDHNPDGWHHLALVVETEGNRRDFFLYLDGDPADQKSSFSAIRDGVTDIWIGGDEASFFEGGIDDIRLWESVRTHHDVSHNMSKRLSGLETSLIGYWPLNEGRGDRGYDYSWKEENHQAELPAGMFWDYDDVPRVKKL